MDGEQEGHVPAEAPIILPEGCASSPPIDDESFVRFFSRHLVSLGCIYERWTEEGEWAEKKFSISAFAFLLKGVWHLATAGQVIEEIESFLAQPGKRNERFVLFDGFASEARYDHLVPFDYKDALRWKLHHEEGGADFGVIVIDSINRRLLEANGGRPRGRGQLEVAAGPGLPHLYAGRPAERTHGS